MHGASYLRKRLRQNSPWQAMRLWWGWQGSAQSSPWVGKRLPCVRQEIEKQLTLTLVSSPARFFCRRPMAAPTAPKASPTSRRGGQRPPAKVTCRGTLLFFMSEGWGCRDSPLCLRSACALRRADSRQSSPWVGKRLHWSLFLYPSSPFIPVRPKEKPPGWVVCLLVGM